ncbi:uncharacterized protein LOC126802942 [Argentina anserina]|uniref:uncharacterized protein LOC126802942 n=1 Tax=Argentina anserina TaxID=57926 RepID=UPI0021766925|nr:uncharacterized protein LOC126802942 [Potentilla anserina]XP_050386623.1 uncharacterized protein LOC126802942 [Potentilla anserina]
MRKKLDTRFPAARIKKIMQTDEDVGKIALAVPLLVSKALELFLQDLCDRTYDITLKRGAKTMNSLHLKQCVKTCSVFDFLKDIVSKVPDLGGSDAVGEEGTVAKRRRVSADDEDTESDDEAKRSRMVSDAGNGGGSGSGRGRGRGRGRPRGRPRGSRTLGREINAPNENCEDDLDIVKREDKLDEPLEQRDDATEPKGSKENVSGSNSAETAALNFDLNVDLNEKNDSATTSAAIPAPDPANLSSQFTLDMKHVEFLGWPLTGMEKMAIDPVQLANLTRRIDEDDEDYDED